MNEQPMSAKPVGVRGGFYPAGRRRLKNPEVVFYIFHFIKKTGW